VNGNHHIAGRQLAVTTLRFFAIGAANSGFPLAFDSGDKRTLKAFDRSMHLRSSDTVRRGGDRLECRMANW
jgi:hypothetical protein